MIASTSMLHVRIDEKLHDEASEKLADLGMTVSDAVRILLTSVVRDGALPEGLMADRAGHDAWFSAQVHEALADRRPPIAHRQVMDDVQSLIDGKRRGRS